MRLTPVKISDNCDIIPPKGMIFVTNIEKNRRDSSKVLIPDERFTQSNIRNRWAQVYQVGDNVYGIKKNQWVLLKHGYWSEIFLIEKNNEVIELQVIIEKNVKEGVLGIQNNNPFE